MKLKYILFFLILALAGNLIAQNKFNPTYSLWVASHYSYEDYDIADAQSGFSMKTTRLTIKGKSTNNWGYHFMGDMYGPSGSPVLMQAWVSYIPNKSWTIRMGQFKYPIGGETYPALIHWKFINPTPITSRVVVMLGSEGGLYRDIGMEAATTFEISPRFGGFAKINVFNGNGPNKQDNDRNKDFVVNAGLNLPANSIASMSYFKGRGNTEYGDINESAFAILASTKGARYTLQAEYLRIKKKDKFYDNSTSGFYAYGTYIIKPSELGFRFDSYKPKTDSTEWYNGMTASVGYYLNKINRVLLNVEMRKYKDETIKIVMMQFLAAF